MYTITSVCPKQNALRKNFCMCTLPRAHVPIANHTIKKILTRTKVFMTAEISTSMLAPSTALRKMSARERTVTEIKWPGIKAIKYV